MTVATFDLTGHRLESVSGDTALHLTLSGDWQVTVENDYEYGRSDDGPLLRTAAGDEPAIVALLTAAVGTTVSSFAYTADGHLRLGLGPGELLVEPCRNFESWGLVGPDRQRVISMPGGSLAVWS